MTLTEIAVKSVVAVMFFGAFAWAWGRICFRAGFRAGWSMSHDKSHQLIEVMILSLTMGMPPEEIVRIYRAEMSKVQGNKKEEADATSN